MCGAQEVVLIAIVILAVISLLYIWKSDENLSIQGILKKNGGCFDWNNNRCLRVYKESIESLDTTQPVDEDVQCLLITVYLKCVFTGCNMRSANLRKRMADELKQDLSKLNIECVFRYNGHRAMCMHAHKECYRVLYKNVSTNKDLACSYISAFFQCYFKSCATTKKEQLEFIRENENHVAESYKCDFVYNKNLYNKYDCSDKNNLYRCGSGECIHKDFICDGIQLCSDGSDEKYCEFMKKKSTSYSLKRQRQIEEL